MPLASSTTPTRAARLPPSLAVLDFRNGSFASKAAEAVGPCTSATPPKADVNSPRWLPPLSANKRLSHRSKKRCYSITSLSISAFRWVPPFAQGQVRDLRVRWALEEAGLPYRARLLELGDQDKPEYRALQPFGQVPIFEEDGRVLFESGAIVLQSGSAAKRSCLRT
jgi:hypothetical protein